MKLLCFFILIINTSVVVFINGNVTCRDEDNNPVDWYFMYKFPKLKTSPDSLTAGGKKHMFLTSSNVDSGWKISSKAIDSNTSILFQTLSVINDLKQQVFWLSYNDQNLLVCFKCGHTKGVVAGDESGGFWLVHSIPRLIQKSYPFTGYTNGQSALCITMTREELNSIGDLLIHNQPRFRRYNILDSLKSVYPKLVAAYQGQTVTMPYSITKDVTSVKGTKFFAFAKANKFDRDLYEWVAQTLQVNILAETWINGFHILPSSCKLNYKVLNVDSMAFDKLGLEYSSHKDHSKLGISSLESSPWVCVGDINRAKSQMTRGGGTVCLNDKNIWKLYSSLVNSTEDCNKGYKHEGVISQIWNYLFHS